MNARCREEDRDLKEIARQRKTDRVSKRSRDGKRQKWEKIKLSELETNSLKELGLNGSSPAPLKGQLAKSLLIL